jgi:opacity protein-like surface antigen
MLTKLLTAAALAAALAAVSAAPATSAVTGKCLPKEVKVKGHSAIANCGAATATLHYKGATYRFKNGTCLKTAGTITLDLGTHMVGDDNLGLAHFSLTMLSTATAPILATSGKLVINGTAKLSSRGASGTFTGTSTVVKGMKISETPLSGTWHCGAVYAF